MDNFQACSALLKGIQELNYEGEAVPCALELSGADAVPIAKSPKGHVLIAAAQYGRGRVVVTAHEAYLLDGPQPFEPFIQNAIDWLKPDTHSLVGVCGLKNLKNFLSECGTNVKAVPKFEDTVDVFCCTAYRESQADELLDFVKRGGSLLIGGQAWWWSHVNPGVDVKTRFPGNKVTGPTGIFFTNKYGEKGIFKVFPHV